MGVKTKPEFNLGLVPVSTGKDVKLNTLIYGPSDAGKTTLLESAMSFPETNPMFFIDIDGGTASISGTRMEVFRPKNFSEVQEAYNFLRFENKGYFKSVGIDTLTEMQQKLSMGGILGVLEQDASFTNLADHTPPNRHDWLSSGEQMRRNIRAFKSLTEIPKKSHRMHVFFTCLERFDENQMTVLPALPGQLGYAVGALVDLMGRLSIEDVEVDDVEKEYRRFVLKKHVDEDTGVTYLGRARIPKGAKFPRVIWNPTARKLVTLWGKRYRKTTKGGN